MPAVRLLVSTRMATLLKTLTGVKYDGTRQLLDLLVNLLSKWLRRARFHTWAASAASSAPARGFSLSLPSNSQSSTPTTSPMLRPYGIDKASYVYGHVLQMISHIFKFAVEKARDVFDLNWSKVLTYICHLGGFEEELCSKLKRKCCGSTSLKIETGRSRVPAQAFQGS